jgi:hypothetical protein
MFFAMDREAIARAQRRRQASDALEFERERAAGLQEQIDTLIVELDGPRVDEEAFAKMAAEDAELARSLLSPVEEPADEADEDEWLIFGDDPPEDDEEPDPRAEAEAEIVRLQEEIAESRRRQDALERYIEALDGSS